ncbi:uncharacterized protein [Asterias amurensis]|uniref:uncharacterized protein n=1 Tax=Asterias amurensis TaxID=7602 RepID=UPI003AB30BB6
MELNPVLGPGDCPQPGMWYVISSMGQHPSMRVGHTCSHIPGKTTDDKGRLLVIGGADPSGAYGDSYLLDLDAYQWSTPDYSGLRPRYEHAVFQPVSQPSKIFVFCGADQGRNMNDIQVLDLDEGKWTTADVTGTPPSPRTCRNCASSGDKLYVFCGGHQGAEPVSDRQLYIFDAASMAWTNPDVKGKKPTCRHGHVMVAVGNKIYLHGGMARETFFNDMHEFDTRTLTWKQVRCKGDIPLGCTAHGAVAVGNKIFMFGGMSPNGALDTAYMFDTSNSRWRQVKIEGAPPASRLDFAVCTARLYYDQPTTDDTQAPDSETLSAIVNAATSGTAGTESPSNVDVKSTIEQGTAIVGSEPAPTDSRGDSRGDNVGENETLPSENACASTSGTTVDVFPPEEGAVASTTEGSSAGTQGSIAGDQGNCLVLVVHGGMDTQGEVFDDCLVLRLDDLL